MKRRVQKDNEEMQQIITDPFGSYTGRTAETGEQPVQDADDL